MSYDHLKAVYRYGDIERRTCKTPDWVKTPSVYIHASDKRPLDRLPDEELRRGLCAKSGGDLRVCEQCPGDVCRVARILLARKRSAT